MFVAELQVLDEVKGLIARGRQIGVLCHAEIASAACDAALDDADIEDLRCLSERCEIELVEEIDPATAVSLNIERAPDKCARRKAAVDLKPDGTTDALQLFPEDIGRARLLSAEEEVDLAKRIWRVDLPGEAGDGRVHLRLVVSIAKHYRNHGAPFRDLTRRGRSAWCAPRRSSSTARASSSQPTRRGGSARRSAGRWPISPG